MDLYNAITTRRSIRSYLERPVPSSEVEEIIKEALWAPSSHNCQPWEIVAATGNCLERVQKQYRERFDANIEPQPQLSLTQTYPDEMFTRYRRVGAASLSSVGIDPADKVQRRQYTAEMFSMFNAPTVLFLLLDNRLEFDYHLVDTGILTQTICLLAASRGLGTCIMAMAAFYPDILQQELAIGDDKTSVLGIALGYPDPDSPLNSFERERDPLDSFFRWVK